MVAHLLVLTGCAWAAYHRPPAVAALILGNGLLIIGIVEGAFHIGWRLTQLPKSQALEFLLVTPMRPRLVFLAEGLVGLTRLVFINLVGLPLLLLFTLLGRTDPATHVPLPPVLLPSDLIAFLVMPITWGAFTGFGIVVWAYETKTIRRWGERIIIASIIFYLVVGVVVGENLYLWLDQIPEEVSLGVGGLSCTMPVRSLLRDGFQAFHLYNPFGVMRYWCERYGASAGETEHAWRQFLWLETGALAAIGLFLSRGASRLQGHFHDRHYSLAVDESRGSRGHPGDRPLTWWAVRRVTEYSGSINLWLAAGFGVLFAIFTVAESRWPDWLGRGVFLIFEKQAGGIPGIASFLVILAAVPAAFQYGLWDSNAQDRCRRLELLLLTQLDARDYWHAAGAAAWRRGRGYFVVAMILWLAAAIAGKAGIMALAVALASAIILWSLYFVLGFRAFTRGMQANNLGILLTVGVPLLTYGLFRAGWVALAVLLPPGSVYAPAAGLHPLYWLPGPALAAILAVVCARMALARCDSELRRWYEMNHGRNVME